MYVGCLSVLVVTKLHAAYFLSDSRTLGAKVRQLCT